jgi:hypothetical protein
MLPSSGKIWWWYHLDWENRNGSIYLKNIFTLTSKNRMLSNTRYNKKDYKNLCAFIKTRSMGVGAKSRNREVLLKGKTQYSWPPCTSLFRWAPFKLKIMFMFLTKQATLMRRSTVQSLPLQLVFPGRSLSLL